MSIPALILMVYFCTAIPIINMRLTVLPQLLVIIISIGAQAQTPTEIPLWENGAPGFEDRRNEPAEAKDWWVKNIHNPTLTVFLPPEDKATGAAVVICPGGGHRELVFDAEGRDPALFLNSIGVAAFVLKYRLAREKNSPYTIDEHVKADAYRAMRMVRGNAKEWHIDPTRIGMLGFSAGGEVVALVAYDSGNGNPSAGDPIDRVNGKPDFQMLVYPGPLGIPASLPANAPPAFLLAANDDACCSGPVITLLQKYQEAKVPVEAHVFTQGAHGFNMGYRSPLSSIQGWPQRMADWLSDNKYLNKSPASK
jgi:acetyl esterase/lipase